MLVGASVLMAEPASSGAFPGTNAKIAFQSNRDGNDEIYVMDADGSNQTNLTNSNDLYEGSPSWSPDGTKIVFRSAGRGYFGGAGQNGDIFVMDANGSNQTNLTNGVGSYHSPSWSPDGSKIVFSKSSEIWVMGSDGSNQIQISPNGGTAGSPSWSPDGSKILFSSLRAGVSEWATEVFVMDADGSNQTQISNPRKLRLYPFLVPGRLENPFLFAAR